MLHAMMRRFSLLLLGMILTYTQANASEHITTQEAILYIASKVISCTAKLNEDGFQLRVSRYKSKVKLTDKGYVSFMNIYSIDQQMHGNFSSISFIDYKNVHLSNLYYDQIYSKHDKNCVHVRLECWKKDCVKRKHKTEHIGLPYSSDTESQWKNGNTITLSFHKSNEKTVIKALNYAIKKSGGKKNLF